MWPATIRRLVSLLVGGGVAFALLASGGPRAAVAVATIALGVGLPSLLSPRAGAAIDRVLARFSALVGKVLTVVLLTASFFLFVLPAGLFLRVLGRRPLAVRPDARATTYWDPIPSSTTLYERTYLREALPPDRPSALTVGFACLGVATVLAVLNAYWGMYLRRTEDLRAIAPTIEVERNKPAWHGSLEWLEQYVTEERESAERRYVPFVGWRHADYGGEVLNVEGGLRRTLPPGAPDDPEVAMYGGSALWGIGARDAHTIPSEVARVLADAGRAARVVNYGEPGYTLWQDVLLFQHQLATGQRPRVAVFYDGINELMVQTTDGPADAEPTHFGAKRLQTMLYERNHSITVALRENNGLATFVRELREPLTGPAADPELDRPLHEYVAPAARDYRAALSVAIAVGKQFGVPVLFFWQPALATREPPVPGEAIVRDEITHLARQREAYAALTAAVDAPPLVRLDRVFDGRAEPFYFDYVHVNEDGNRLVAERIAERLLPVLDGERSMAEGGP